MAEKYALIATALDVASFFLVTTDLYGHQRLEALTGRVKRCIRVAADGRLLAQSRPVRRIAQIGATIYIGAGIAAALWVLFEWLVNRGRYDLLGGAGAAVEAVGYVVLAVSVVPMGLLFVMNGAATAALFVLRQAQFQGLLLLSGTVLFLMEKALAVAVTLDYL